MGTKSHISKALPASIMTRGIGLIMLRQAAFSARCVYLKFPGHFLYVVQQQNAVDGKFLCQERRRGNVEVLCFHILLHSALFYMEALVCEFSFDVLVKSICFGSAWSLFSPDCMPRGFFSPSQNIHYRGSRSLALSLWALASIFHMHYETQLIKLQVYAMTRPPSICNKSQIFSSVFS